MIDIDPTKGPVYSGAGQRKDANPIRNDSNDSTGAYQTNLTVRCDQLFERMGLSGHIIPEGVLDDLHWYVARTGHCETEQIAGTLIKAHDAHGCFVGLTLKQFVRDHYISPPGPGVYQEVMDWVGRSRKYSL